MDDLREHSSAPHDEELKTQIDTEESASEAIVRILAIAENIKPTELPPLYNCLDL